MINIDYSNMNEINRIAQYCKKSGYYNCDESYEDIAEKIAYILVTTDILEKCDTRAGVLKSIIRRLNNDLQFRDTFAQATNLRQNQRNRDIQKRGGSERLQNEVLCCFNIESCRYIDENGDSCNAMEPEDKKSDRLKYEQHIAERVLWTYENMFLFFRDFLKKDFTRADISDSTRFSWKTQFNKTFEATWKKPVKGAKLVLFKKTRGKIELDTNNKYFNSNAIFITDYIYQFNRDVYKSGLWREHLNRVKAGKRADWCEKHRLRFDACLAQLSEINRDKVQKWLNYEYKVNSYEDLKLFNEVFLAAGNDQFLENVKVALRADDFKDVEDNCD